MRPLRPLLAASLLLLLPSVPAARAGDEAAEAARRFQDEWSRGLEALDPAGVDARRAALLEPVVASGTEGAFEAVLSVARERAYQVSSFRKRLEKIREREEEAERRKADPPPEGAGGEKPAEETPSEKRRREEEEGRVADDKRFMPGRIEREERWQARLAAAAATLLDGVSDADFRKAAVPKLQEAVGDRCEGWGDWMAAALGASRRERTAEFLLDAAADSLKEYRKALAGRTGPARDLDKANQKINDILLKYLESRQKAGDFSGQYPSNLIPDAVVRDRSRLEAEVQQWTTAMDGADLSRRALRDAVGSMLAGGTDELRGKLLDLLEKQVLGGKDFEARIFGLVAIGPCPGDRAMRILREAAKDTSADVVVASLEALGRRSEAEAGEILGAALTDPRWQVRGAAAAGLGEYGRAAGVPPLIAALAGAEGRTIDDDREALVKITGQAFPPVAAAWEEWWKKAGATFRGPKDPRDGPAGGPAAGGPAPAGDAPTASEQPGGNKVSFYGIETNSNRILFVLDFSGSMNFAGSEKDKARQKIDILREEFKRTVLGMPDGAKFNVIGFSSDVRVWHKGPAARDSRNAKEVIDWVEKQKVVGSTNIYDAFEQGFRMMGVGASADRSYEPAFDTIYFMTDGVPTSGKVTDKTVILQEVRRWNEARRIRIHVIGMGGKEKGRGGGAPGGPADDVDKDFLQKLADQNGGQCVFR